MDKLIGSAKKEALVEMVKLAQKRGMVGSKGGWKEFLKVYDKKFGASLSDPSRRPVDSLVAFLKTFEQVDDLKFFKKVLQCHRNRDEVEQLKKTSPKDETAEQRLVRLTLEHPLYPIDYSFPSHEEEWMVIKHKKKSKSPMSNEMIAIDCEMVLCEDGTEALVKVCAVDRNLEVKLDKVVHPKKEIADYRTDITGISAKDLDGVTHTLKDVQKSLKKILSHGAILVGHSLSNDLQALKLDYSRVVDTSYVFKYANGLMYKKPSLSWLCYELREQGNPHNCLDDACTAMKLVTARLEGRINDVIDEEVRESDVAKLLVHRIPNNVLSKDLSSILHGEFTIEVKMGKKVRNTYSAFAIFKDQQEAIKAFDKLEGSLEKDSCGRLQKLVKFELDSGISGTLCVCKIFHEISDQLTKKRPAEDENTLGISKKLKTDEILKQLEDCQQCEAYLKEIERLQTEINKRDEEISSLNKIVAVLTRKQGL
ncbi:small RNA degrading nuclease 1-like isoform X2 [Andrographis paniculata]|uniref:small RNA degrading nuclease 1-like isoform X2 n=1 Tax=Andrographis paniculata TaxID=175694 RepID=UPI0021E930BD|nr:small RNA degrading nuclease 1-like isoform X2 [Andrographis paniculata]